MNAQDFRRLALLLEGAEEGSHMGAVDFRVGGTYHFVGLGMDGDTATCSFRGTYLEIERPVRLVGT